MAVLHQNPFSEAVGGDTNRGRLPWRMSPPATKNPKQNLNAFALNKHPAPMKYVFLIIILIAGAVNICLAQRLVASEPEMLSDSVNSNAEDTYPLLSPNSGRLYFVRAFHTQNNGGELAGQDIWYSEQDNAGNWQTAVNVSELNTVDNNVVVGISPEEDTLYLLNTYSVPLRQNRGISYSVKKEDGWGKPQELDLVFKNQGDFNGYYVTPDGETVVVSTNGIDSYGEEDIYIYRKENGKWRKPIHLSDSINTPGFEISPFLSEEKEMLFFASNGHEGLGDADIFMTRRLDSTWTNWSKPVNLGKGINSPGFDAYFSLYRDGQAFFASNRRDKFANIYSVSIAFESDSLPPPAPVAALPDTVPQETIVQETFYTVQILALKKREAPGKDFFATLDLDLISMYVGKDGFNRFSIGQYNSFSLALEEMDKLRKSGYPDAFIRKIERYTELSVRQGESIVVYYSSRE